MLSVIIPYYKINFFKETLQSLALQTDKRFKVYIGDDESPNNPLALIKNFYDKFDLVYYRFNKNLGSKSLVQHWNRCIDLDETENEWIMILGDDDVLDKNVVEEFYNQRNNFEDSIDVVRFSSTKINSKSDFTSNEYNNPINEKATDFLFREKRSSLSEYVFRKKKLLNTGFKNFPLAWHSDVLAVLEVSDFKEIYSISEAVVKIRISDESISGSNNNMSKKLDATFQFYYYLLNFKNEFFNENQKQILLEKLKNSYFHRKKSFGNFVKISLLYLKYFSIPEYLDFLKSFWYKIKN
jgi:hypothetical protein